MRTAGQVSLQVLQLNDEDRKSLQSTYTNIPLAADCYLLRIRMVNEARDFTVQVVPNSELFTHSCLSRTADCVMFERNLKAFSFSCLDYYR